MNPDRPSKRDYQITGDLEKSLFYYQIGQKLIREKIEKGEGNESDQKQLAYLDEYVPVFERFVQEKDPDEREILKDQLDQIKEKHSVDSLGLVNVEERAKEFKEQGKFIGFRKIYTGEFVAVFTDWSQGNEILFNKSNLENQIKRFKEAGKPTEELERALNSWPREIH